MLPLPVYHPLVHFSFLTRTKALFASGSLFLFFMIRVVNVHEIILSQMCCSLESTVFLFLHIQVNWSLCYDDIICFAYLSLAFRIVMTNVGVCSVGQERCLNKKRCVICKENLSTTVSGRCTLVCYWVQSSAHVVLCWVMMNVWNIVSPSAFIEN